MKRLLNGEAYRPTGYGINCSIAFSRTTLAQRYTQAVLKFLVTIQLLLNNHREHRVHRDNFFEYEIDENFIFNSFVYFRI
ncbi:MAG: hypothetical protein LBJ00_08400, partial [Planctomycetaceae bacterium]|nr:hypothetical protein [Planctomycetaceae bacterium]